jgi:urocanate hydratase
MGGMSGAQPKACQLVGCIGVIAEVSEEAAKKRYDQGWCQELIYDLNQLIDLIRECREKKIATSIGYVGNVVDVWLEDFFFFYIYINLFFICLGNV